jgi:hypothetical protein
MQDLMLALLAFHLQNCNKMQLKQMPAGVAQSVQ